jgi:D-alanyl-D-alanine carboxypeptidase (penicillin-binding protein 5/6)
MNVLLNFYHKKFQKKCKQLILLTITILLALVGNIFADDIKQYSYLDQAEYYFLIDADSKEVLLSKNSNVAMAPSSMTKLMTAYIVFDLVKKGAINLRSQCLIGKDAWKKSGSSMFLNYGDIVSIEDLVKGLLAVSGNDAAIALAESTAGGYNNFIDLMNKKAKELGMYGSQFKNPHGLNQEGHYMTLKDLATLTARLYDDFPQYKSFLHIQEFTYHNIVQKNRNPLIRNNYEGIVGGKTGYTNQGGYGLAAIVKRNNRKLVAVVNKAKTPKIREKIITDLFDYGFNEYKKISIFEKGQILAYVDTWLGEKEKIPAVLGQNISFTVLKDKPIDDIEALVKINNPVLAPIKKNQKIGELIINVKGQKKYQLDLFAKENVDKVGYIRKIKFLIKYNVNNFLKKYTKYSL